MNENTLILTEHRLVPRLFDAALTLLAGRISLFLYANLWMQITNESDYRWGVIIASFKTVLIFTDRRAKRLAADPVVSI